MILDAMPGEFGKASDRRLSVLYRARMGKAAQMAMIQDIDTSIGVFDVSDEDYLFMKEFIANAVYDDYDRLVQLCIGYADRGSVF